ncbi:zinc-ribbon domain containing protein [Candidatus Falkowbacteria bacterium]|nr:zinc-ribbon domain containing protein [Candidatus Falkowbacteria bacterium]
MPKCKQCTTDFPITDADKTFYAKIDVPKPTRCPQCRRVRRLSYRNEITLYPAICGLCKKSMISMYNPDGSYVVYCQDCWWGDGWDPTASGQTYDPSRSFFEQFSELMKKVPRISLINKEADNSEYCNFSWRNKNSYLLFTGGENDDVFYANRCWKCRSSIDCSNLYNCELCYEATDSANCYNCAWLEYSTGCSDCWLGYNLSGCSDCFGCVNLSNQKFHIFNTPVPEAEYRQRIAELKKDLPAAAQLFRAQKMKGVRKYANIIKSVNCSGDSIVGSKNCQSCFRVKDAEDCKYVCDTTLIKDSYDVDNDDHSELLYECIGNESNHNQQFIDICWFDRDIQYCSLCMSSKNLFGCVGMKNAEYCILNKKYSAEEYETLRQQIIVKMKQDGEYGEFFPSKFSPFGYNETNASLYYELKKEQAVAAGFTWQDNLPSTTGKETLKELPADISQVNEGITKEILACQSCGKNYKFIPQEVKLYKMLGVPLPPQCFRCRHVGRIHRRNGQTLYSRTCMKDGCKNSFETPYAPDRKEVVYCEECYQKEIY